MTPCILEELRLLGENFRGIYLAARKFPKEKCSHTGTVIPNECIKSLIGKRILENNQLNIMNRNR